MLPGPTMAAVALLTVITFYIAHGLTERRSVIDSTVPSAALSMAAPFRFEFSLLVRALLFVKRHFQGVGNSTRLARQNNAVFEVSFFKYSVAVHRYFTFEDNACAR